MGDVKIQGNNSYYFPEPQGSNDQIQPTQPGSRNTDNQPYNPTTTPPARIPNGIGTLYCTVRMAEVYAPRLINPAFLRDNNPVHNVIYIVIARIILMQTNIKTCRIYPFKISPFMVFPPFPAFANSPCGRIKRIRIISPNATASQKEDAPYATLNTSATPR